jgi:hypothetical protein
VTLPVPVHPVGTGLLTILNTALSALLSNLADSVGGPVARAVIAPGAAAAADGCCYDDAAGLSGQAHVRLSRLYPSTRFPQPDATYSRMPTMLAAEIELGVYRCVAGLDDGGNPPPPDEVTADAVRALDDVAALQKTALGTFGRTPVVLGQVVTLGPGGYCAGAVQLFTIAFNQACPPGVVVEE